MAINSDVNFVKGSFNVTLFTELPTENLVNAIQFVPTVQVPQLQSAGSQLNKAVDLLKITESYVFKCAITKTDSKSAKDIKDELKSLAKGAGINGGGPITMTYEDDALTGYITNLVFKKVNNDNAQASYPGKDSKEYDVTITFTLGEAVA